MRKKPRDWLNERVRVFFVDPVNYSIAPTNVDANGTAQGFELTFPKEWVAKAMPYVRLGLTALRVASVAGKLVGLPIPDVQAVLGEFVESQMRALDEIKDEAFGAMAAMTA